MATYGGAVDLILTEMARSDSSITAIVEREVLKAIEFYAAERFWFNEFRASLTHSATIFYPFATAGTLVNMLEIDQVSVTVNGSVEVLQKRTHQELNAIDSSGTTGSPTDWAILGEQLRLYPKAPSGSTYQVDVDGTRRLATLSASTDTNAWTNQGLNLIAARTQKNLWARRFSQPEKAQVCDQAEQEELRKLRERSTAYLTTGRVRPGY